MAIRDILTDDQLTILREQFDPQQMNALLGASLSADYPPSVPHLATIGDLFRIWGQPLAPTRDESADRFTDCNGVSSRSSRRGDRA